MTIEEARLDLMLTQADIFYRPKDETIDMAIKALENQKTGVKKWYKIFIRSAFDQYEEYKFHGSKCDLMTLIGCLHSTRMVKIERIDYREVKSGSDIPCAEIKFFIDKSESIHIFKKSERR